MLTFISEQTKTNKIKNAKIELELQLARVEKARLELAAAVEADFRVDLKTEDLQLELDLVEQCRAAVERMENLKTNGLAENPRPVFLDIRKV